MVDHVLQINDRFQSNLLYNNFGVVGISESPGTLTVPENISQEDVDSCCITEEQVLDQLFYSLWEKTWQWVYKQLALQDMTIISGWYAANLLNEQGRQGYLDLVNWQDQLFSGAYIDAKEQLAIHKTWIEPDWSTWPSCPHDFYFFYNNRSF